MAAAAAAQAPLTESGVAAAAQDCCEADRAAAAQAAAKAFIRATSRKLGWPVPAPAPVVKVGRVPEPTLGVGFAMTTKGAQVIAVMPKSPAEGAGLRQGMIISSVNGVSLAGMGLDAATSTLRSATRPAIVGLSGGGQLALRGAAPQTSAPGNASDADAD